MSADRGTMTSSDPAAASGPRLIFPAIYVDNVSYLKRPLRVSYLLGAVHVQYRAPNQYDYEAVKRALLWG